MSYNLGLWMLWLLQYHDMTMAIIKKYEGVLNVFESRSWEAKVDHLEVWELRIQEMQFYTKVMWSYVLFQTEEYFM